MIRAFRALIAMVGVAVLASCGGGDSAMNQPVNKFRSYDGPPVTQIVVKKSDRKLYLIHGKSVLKAYQINLGNQPVGTKRFEGDGKTPEGMFFIDRINAQSRYHLSVGINYPRAEDVAFAATAGRRPGGDIFIHGLGPEGRAINRPDWTAGCIAVNDQEIEEIFAMVKPGVPVFIYP